MKEETLKSFNDLVTTNKDLKNDILDKYLTGSQQPIELNADYSNYENFVNFSSAEKRLSNFKYKLQLIESYTAQSSSIPVPLVIQKKALDIIQKSKKSVLKLEVA